MKEYIKLTFISGLSEIVLRELELFPSFRVVTTKKDCIYLQYHETVRDLFSMKSILNIFLVRQDPQLHPAFLHNHKSVLGNLLEQSLSLVPAATFKLFCAGSDSPEIHALKTYIQDHFKLEPVATTEQTDKKIIIANIGTFWELAISVNNQPLSIRPYRVEHLTGSLNPTIAYAINQLAHVSTARSYLNIFSGAATLPIEAMFQNPNLAPVGFDYDSKRISKSIQNIQQAGYIKNITIKKADLFDSPNLGTFDVITSDLPFGMQINKDQDMDALYTTFAKYCTKHLNLNGTLVVYTSETELLEQILIDHQFDITKKITLTLVSSEGSYLYPTIMVCKKPL